MDAHKRLAIELDEKIENVSLDTAVTEVTAYLDDELTNYQANPSEKHFYVYFYRLLRELEYLDVPKEHKPQWIALECLISLLKDAVSNGLWDTDNPEDEVNDQELNKAISYAINVLTRTGKTL